MTWAGDELSSEEAAAILGYTLREVAALLLRGELPGLRREGMEGLASVHWPGSAVGGGRVEADEA